MSMITIRARDSVSALEQVERRLGSDALIHALVTVDGQVEVVASPGGAAAPPPRATAAPAEDRPEDRPEATVSPAPALDVLIDDDPLEAETAPDPERAIPAANLVHLPKFLQPGAPRPFAEVLEQVKAATPVPKPVPVPAPEIAPVEADPAALRARLLAAPRVVLCGPVGAGKSLAALQFALMRSAAAAEATAGIGPNTGIDFVFCGNGSVSDGALLAQKSHLLGMRMIFDIPDSLAPPRPGRAQIVVISGRVDNAPELARQALSLPGSEAALVLPAGLRPERLARAAETWAGVTRGAILSAPEEAPSSSEEQDDIARAGFTALWDTVPGALLDGLRDIAPAAEAVADTAAETTPETAAPDMAHPVFRFRRKSSPETRP